MPGMKTPKNIDPDGFKRADGKPIYRHIARWKIRSICTAEVISSGDDLEFSLWLKKAVEDNEFREYEFDNAPNWGDPIVDVASIIKNKKKKTVGYILESGEELSRASAIRMAEQGELDNVTVFTSSQGYKYLRTKPDNYLDNNLGIVVV